MKSPLAYIDVGGTDNLIKNPIPSSPSGGDISKLPTDFIGNAIKIMLLVVALAAVGAIVYGGILYITSGGDPDKAARGRRSLTYGIIAVVLVMLSYLIYNTLINRVSGTP